MKPEEEYRGQGRIKQKITRACFYTDGNEAEGGKRVAGVNFDKYRSDFEKSRGDWIQIKVRRTAETMERGAGKFIDLVGRGGCFILMASDFLSEALSQREGVKFRVGMGLDVEAKI